MHTEWNLKLFYTSARDPRIKKDLSTILAAYTRFAKKYTKNKKHLTNENALFRALTDYERLIDTTASMRPLIYFYLRKYLNSADTEAQARISQYTQTITKAENTLLFFTLEIGKIASTLQKRFLAAQRLAHFHYFLKRLFEQNKYHLSEAEEKIMNLKALPAHTLWTQGFQKVLNQQMVPFGKKTIPVSEALSTIRELPTQKRHKLHRATMEKLKSVSDFAESEINAIVTDKKINDELRGFKKPYTNTILRYENKDATIENLVATVTKAFPIGHRFYALKARLLKLKKLTSADRAAHVSLSKKKRHIRFSEAVKIVQRAFTTLDPFYAEEVGRMVRNGQVDVYPKQGKRGGAFQLHSHNNPTVILLNHINTPDSVMTLGHEMGHAMHSRCSAQQSPLYEDYTIATAEVASTFFEQFVFAELTKHMDERELITALHDQIEDDMGSIFRQITFFNFELELHEKIREKGGVSKEEIAELMNKHMHAQLGPTFSITPLDGYFFAAIGHIRTFFYVYSYAFGSLISKALYAQFQKDPTTTRDRVKAFLSAGSSASPEDIFKSIGIDVTKPSFFKEGLEQIDRDITRLEQLMKKYHL